jgi:hypothetical protein
LARGKLALQGGGTDTKELCDRGIDRLSHWVLRAGLTGANILGAAGLRAVVGEIGGSEHAGERVKADRHWMFSPVRGAYCSAPPAGSVAIEVLLAE